MHAQKPEHKSLSCGGSRQNFAQKWQGITSTTWQLKAKKWNILPLFGNQQPKRGIFFHFFGWHLQITFEQNFPFSLCPLNTLVNYFGGYERVASSSSTSLGTQKKGIILWRVIGLQNITWFFPRKCSSRKKWNKPRSFWQLEIVENSARKIVFFAGAFSQSWLTASIKPGWESIFLSHPPRLQSVVKCLSQKETFLKKNSNFKNQFYSGWKGKTRRCRCF